MEKLVVILDDEPDIVKIVSDGLDNFENFRFMAVNPTPKLKRIAVKRGWEVIDAAETI